MSKYGFSKGYAQVSYERLILTQPDIKFQGLWHKDDIYYISCRDCDTSLAHDGSRLSDWFREHCRILGYRVELVDSAPEGSTRVSPRNTTQLSQLNGAPLNISEFYLEIRRQLPKEIPSFRIEDAPESLTIISSQPLSTDHEQLITIAVANFGLDIEVIFKSEAPSGAATEPPMFHLLDGRLKNYAQTVTDAHEASEQLWFDSRLSLFASDHTDGGLFIPSINREQTACFIDCTFGSPGNIRNYLTAYTTIYLSPPASGLDILLHHLVVSERELIKLVELGRVIIVLQMDLHIYDKYMVHKFVEAGRGRTVLGRQLAGASIAEARRRNPLLYPAMDNEARRDLLDLITASSNPENARSITAIRRYLGNSWSSLESDFSTQGSRAGFSHGIGRILGEIIYENHRRELPLEFFMCAMSVEWSTALRANYCPTEMPGYDCASAAQLTASIISGIPQRPVVDTASKLEVIVKDLLILDGQAPISEILDIFSEQEINRINGILKRCNYEEDTVEAEIKRINEKVKEFDKAQRAVKRRDLFALAGALAPILSPETAVAWIPLGVWIGQRILDNESGEGSPITDWIKAKNSFTSSEAVFVSRIRKNR